MLAILPNMVKMQQFAHQYLKINFVPKDVQIILSLHKVSEKYNEQEVFYKKSCS